jgi:hypothetical protein
LPLCLLLKLAEQFISKCMRSESIRNPYWLPKMSDNMPSINKPPKFVPPKLQGGIYSHIALRCSAFMVSF